MFIQSLVCFIFIKITKFVCWYSLIVLSLSCRFPILTYLTIIVITVINSNNNLLVKHLFSLFLIKLYTMSTFLSGSDWHIFRRHCYHYIWTDIYTLHVKVKFKKRQVLCICNLNKHVKLFFVPNVLSQHYRKEKYDCYLFWARPCF